MAENVTVASSARAATNDPVTRPAPPMVSPECTPSCDTLPMPCHFSRDRKWHKGTVIQFVVTPLGCQAIIKPSTTNRLVLVDLAYIEHGDVAPTGPAL